MQPLLAATPHTWEMTVCDKAVAVHPMGVFLVAPGKALSTIKEKRPLQIPPSQHDFLEIGMKK